VQRHLQRKAAVNTKRASRMQRHLLFVLVACSGLPLASATAQSTTAGESFLRQQRVVDEKLHQERMEIAPLAEMLHFNWGGWLEYYLFHFDDGVQKSRFAQRPSLVLWTHLSADNGAHELFVRMRLRYSWFRPGDELDRQEDWWGPNFDRAWYQIDIGKAFRLMRPSDPYQLKARIGRQPVLFGTGYALDLPMDAVQLDARLCHLRLLGLFGRSIGSTPNIDRSEPVDSHMHRLFYGVQAAWEGWQRHVPFAYAIWNDDKTDERPKDWRQNYSYDSAYFGLGSRGEAVRNLTYWAEAVFETGRSYGNGQFLRRDRIEAWGWDVGLEYLFDLPWRPRLAAEYLFASGDPDRQGSPTSAAGGNSVGTRDTSFVAFGFRDTGIAAGLFPSNLHIFKFAASCTPFPQIEFLHNLEIGTNWFIYAKNRQRGAISDFTADRREPFVGWEMDYFVNWRLSSDLSWTTRWGVFFPGDAYSDRGARNFIFTGLTWSF